VLLTRSPLYSRSCPRFLVRLACVRHAASVDSEPGSNSRLKPDRLPRRTDVAVRPPRRTDGHSCEIARTETQTSQIQTGSPPRLRVMRSFNFSRLARSTCCQRPFHLTPERGGPVSVDAMAHVLETPGTQPHGCCWETLQAYRESRCPSTHAPTVLRSQNQDLHGAPPQRLSVRCSAYAGSHRRACSAGRQERMTPEGKKSQIKDRSEVLRLTLNPSGNSVPEYRPRGRDRFLTQLIIPDVQDLQGVPAEPMITGPCGTHRHRQARPRREEDGSPAGPVTGRLFSRT
jgi:hypothetical protein